MTTNDDQTPKNTNEANISAGVSCAAASGSVAWEVGRMTVHHTDFGQVAVCGPTEWTLTLSDNTETALREAVAQIWRDSRGHIRQVWIRPLNAQSLATAGAGLSKP